MIGLKLSSISQLLIDATARLKSAGIDGAKLDARLLLQAAGEYSRTHMVANPDELVDREVATKFSDFIDQRMNGKPVFRIIGKREFYGREFLVFDDVLDPRPETELLVERILKDWHGRSPNFIEIGVGSGAICVSLLCEMAMATCTGTDISSFAAKAATANAELNNIETRLNIIQTDCLAGVVGAFDFIVSNPPYISSEEMKALPKEVREHDPHISLEAADNGLAFYSKIFYEARGFLKDQGKLYLESGHGQHAAIVEIGTEMGWGLVSKHLDLSGLERIVVFEEL